MLTPLHEVYQGDHTQQIRKIYLDLNEIALIREVWMSVQMDAGYKSRIVLKNGESLLVNESPDTIYKLSEEQEIKEC